MIITLKDGSTKEYAQPMSVYEIAKDISEGLARVATAGELDGEVVDLRTVVDKDSHLNILTFDDEKAAPEHSVIRPLTLWHRQSSVCIRISSLPSDRPLQTDFTMMWTARLR